MFITFEGIEGSGKTTQLNRLAATLRERGKTVVVTKEPGGTPLADRIRAILLDSGSVIDPVAELFLFAASRRQNVMDVIRPALARGEVVLCDRFTDSTLAYQGFGRLLTLDKLRALHHAIILYGPSPDARRALALRLAQTLNCLNGTTGDDCASCQRIERRTHPDVHWTEVGADKKMISVEQVRDIVAAATLRPYEGRNKVFIVDPAEALSVSGSNSLLKTLEEPPRDTIFLLLTRAYDLLLPTIKSRSQPIYIGGEEPRDEELASSIATALQRYGETRDGAMLLALASLIASHDQPNDAIALLGDALCDAVAGKIDVEITRVRRLGEEDKRVGSMGGVGVNADVRLLVEQVV